jgi:hypothetical protein
MSTAIQSAASALLPTNSSTTANNLFSNTSGSNSGSSSSSTSNSFDDLSARIAAAQRAQDLANQQAGINVQDFQKNTNDVQIDNRMTARNIGNLRENNSRLNVFSSLAKNDAADFFTFNVTSTADTKFNVLTADGSDESNIRFQVINQTGQTVADSSPDSGDAKKAYDQLKAGTLSLQAGKYVLRISRQDDNKTTQASTTYNYAVQLSQGLYQNDFDTIEKGVDTTRDAFGFGSNTNLDTLTSSIAASVSYMQNLDPIGTSATDKLTGVLTSFTS